MRKEEKNFASPSVKQAASRFGQSIRLARLSRNMTQQAAAERAKMSTYTWIKIEKGDVSVSTSSWLSALECVGLLDALGPTSPLALQQGPRLQAVERLRATRTTTTDYNF